MIVIAEYSYKLDSKLMSQNLDNIESNNLMVCSFDEARDTIPGMPRQKEILSCADNLDFKRLLQERNNPKITK